MHRSLAATAIGLAASGALADVEVPFLSVCEVGANACTGEVGLFSLPGPEPGATVWGATIKVTWTTDGTRDASTLGFLLELNVDGTRRALYVTGTDLGFTAPGAGTFIGTLSTEAFNGVVDSGLPGLGASLDLELMPDPQCDPPPNEVICGVWGTFENNAGLGLFSGITFHTDPPPPTCPVDWNGDGGVDVFDLLAYLDDWFSGNGRAELDGAVGITVFDLLAYLNGWFDVTGGAPCP